jgi:enamine deaminase RidA (YjgF/YER057c/UK114 family)
MPAKPKARRHVILPGRQTPLPFSDAVLAGDTLYLAGRIGIDPKTGKAPVTWMRNCACCSRGSRRCLPRRG